VLLEEFEGLQRIKKPNQETILRKRALAHRISNVGLNMEYGMYLVNFEALQLGEIILTSVIHPNCFMYFGGFKDVSDPDLIRFLEFRLSSVHMKLQKIISIEHIPINRILSHPARKNKG
jgi:hypothetical protein